MSPTSQRWLIASATLLAAMFITIGCERVGSAKSAAATKKEPPPTPVTVATAFARDVPVYLDEIGRATARESVSVVPQVGGKIMSAPFTEGADVKKGDLLFEIDPRPFQAALAKEQATLATNRATLERAQLEWRRVEELIQSNAVSREEYDQRRTALAVAEAQVSWAQAAVDQAKLNFDYCTIRAPLDGRTGQRLVDPGNIVKENEGTLVTIQKLDPIYADFTVTEHELRAVRRNMSAGALKTEVSLPHGEKTAARTPTTKPGSTTSEAGSSDLVRIGELTFLDNAVQDATGTVKLRATVPNSDRLFWPGQFVNVRLILSMKKDAVLVPGRATQIGQQGPFVFVVKNDGTAELRTVVPGQKQGDLVVIEQGVQPGEQVVISGQMMIMPGAKVTVTNAPSAQHANAVGSGQMTNDN